MSRNIIPSFVLAAALASLSASALADPPAAVGRVSAVEGQVTVVTGNAGDDNGDPGGNGGNGDTGDGGPVQATLNWPLTGGSRVTTASGGRSEFRLGSTAVRVDGDSDLEIREMDDNLLRLRLNYGSVSIRVRNPEMLRDFELSTPQARITLLEPGLLRVDVERVPDTSQISMLAGSARVDGAGSSVTVGAGRQLDISGDDVRTSVARRDGFDAWGEQRDRLGEAVVTSRFVSSGITGYEELDRNGSWTESVEYGPLWTPRNVALDWAPYRDGRWVWLAPWGWTWVDNAPWGYAPSHYGRWVLIERRWCWAPGRPAGRPVWAPALVGWVGGNGFSHQRRPGLGWFPLSPRERYVPSYRASAEYQQRMTWMHNGRPYTPRGGRNERDDRRDGLTVLPREQFEGRHTVPVQRGPQVIPAPNLVRGAQAVVPPRPAFAGNPRALDTDRRGWQDRDRDHDGIPDRFERNGQGQIHGQRGQAGPGRVLTAPALPQQPIQQQVQQPIQQPTQQPPRSQTINTLQPGQFGTPDAPAQTINPNNAGIELRGRGNYPGRPNGPGVMPAPILHINPGVDRNERDNDERGRDFRAREEQRNQWGERQREQQQRDQQQREQRQQQLQQRLQQQSQQQAQPQSQPQIQPRPQPPAQPQPQAQPQPRPVPQPQPQPQQAAQPQAQPRGEARREAAERGERRRPGEALR